MDKSRYWFVTIQVANMMKAGLTDEQIYDYDYVAKFFLNLWQSSSPTRTGCVTVCKSADGLYHLHAALYGEKTTLASVARLMFDAHVEPCKGGKDNLMKYILKEEQYAETGEVVLHEIGRENIKVHKGKRTDLEEIEELIHQGLTPREIMGMKLSYCRYEKEIKICYIKTLIFRVIFHRMETVLINTCLQTSLSSLPSLNPHLIFPTLSPHFNFYNIYLFKIHSFQYTKAII